jgi:phage terminase Nu1 subunit (DNA packaging protein)
MRVCSPLLVSVSEYGESSSLSVHKFHSKHMATRKRASRETPRAIPLAKATEQRARLASAQADLAELKAAERRGELLDAAEVERTWGGVLRTVRASMLAVPSRMIGARLPHLTAVDIDEIDREVRAALTEVAGDDQI